MHWEIPHQTEDICQLQAGPHPCNPPGLWFPMESLLLCATKDGVNKAEKRGQERGEEGMGGVGEGKRSRGTGSKREERKTEGEKRRGRGTKSNKLKTGSNLGSRGKHPTAPDHTLVSDTEIWAKKEMGALPASRGTQGTKAVLVIPWNSGQRDPSRDLDIRMAYLVLEGAAVTLEECVVFSGIAVSVDVLVVVAMVGLAVIMVVMMIIVVVLIVLVVLADAGQTQDRALQGSEIEKLKPGQLEHSGFSPSCDSTSLTVPPHILQP